MPLTICHMTGTIIRDPETQDRQEAHGMEACWLSLQGSTSNNHLVWGIIGATESYALRFPVYLLCLPVYLSDFLSTCCLLPDQSAK